MCSSRCAGQNSGAALAPIVLFVYNRPQHTRRTVEALRANILAKESDLIVYSDAPRMKDHVGRVSEVRDYVRQIEGFRSVTVIERHTNFGLARSIIDGVTEIVDKYGRVIVLEDDLVTSPSFLEYMNDALEKYSREEQVMQVSGYMFPVDIRTAQETFLLPLTTSWGWATWQRAWRHFDPTGQGYEEVRKSGAKRNAFDLGGAYPYFRMLESQMRGEIDSWAIRWWLSVFRREGLVLYPRKSLVENIGFDGSGTHCGPHTRAQMELSDAVVRVDTPLDPRVNEKMARAVFDHLARAQGRSLARLIRQIMSRLAGGR